MPATITIQPAQRTLLAQALADAIYYRDPPVNCTACTAREARSSRELCADCETALARATAYLRLAEQLGLGVPTRPETAP